MRLNPRWLKDTLTLEGLTPAIPDQNTGVPSGVGTVRLLLSQPCSDQDPSPNKRAQFELANGVSGQPITSVCYAHAQPYTLNAGETLVLRINGRFRPMLRQGPPADMGGQHLIWEIALGPPEDGR